MPTRLKDRIARSCALFVELMSIIGYYIIYRFLYFRSIGWQSGRHARSSTTERAHIAIARSAGYGARALHCNQSNHYRIVMSRFIHYFGSASLELCLVKRSAHSRGSRAGSSCAPGSASEARSGAGGASSTCVSCAHARRAPRPSLQSASFSHRHGARGSRYECADSNRLPPHLMHPSLLCLTLILSRP